MAEPLFALRNEIAQLFPVDPRSVDRMIEAKAFPAVKVGRVVRIPVRPFCEATGLRPEDVFAQLAQMRATSPAPPALVRSKGAAA